MAGGNPMTRYARQMILPQVGPSGQETLAAARVVVVGAGGDYPCVLFGGDFPCVIFPGEQHLCTDE